MTDIQEIPLDDIETIADAQIRVIGTDPGTVSEYAEAMEGGASFPPIILFHDGAGYWPGDGFHRIEAARRLDRDAIEAEIRPGSKRDAVLFACSANATPGLRRTQADKRNAVETMLRDPDWSDLSDRAIAKNCAVDHKTVGRLRRELTGKDARGPGGEFPTSNGKAYTPAADDDRPVLARILARLPDPDLIEECRRRGFEVRRV